MQHLVVHHSILWLIHLADSFYMLFMAWLASLHTVRHQFISTIHPNCFHQRLCHRCACARLLASSLYDVLLPALHPPSRQPHNFSSTTPIAAKPRRQPVNLLSTTPITNATAISTFIASRSQPAPPIRSLQGHLHLNRCSMVWLQLVLSMTISCVCLRRSHNCSYPHQPNLFRSLRNHHHTAVTIAVSSSATIASSNNRATVGSGIALRLYSSFHRDMCPASRGGLRSSR